jgi:spore coat polysaccharide biosynthesis protein SpsF (cytidylyltransferase family)
MKIIAITQARCGSSRLPNKVLKKVNGETLLDIHLNRVLKSKRIDQLIIATTTEAIDNAIAQLAGDRNLSFYRGSTNNVLDRFYQAASPYNTDWVARLTSDCPLIDPVLIDEVIDKALELNVDYCSNTLDPTYPDGVDIEVFKFDSLKKAWQQATLDSEREHVTPFIYKNSSFFKGNLFTAHNFYYHTNYSKVRLTVDEQSDYEVIKLLVSALGTDKPWQAYADFYIQNQSVEKLNSAIQRNEGYEKSLKKD